jgi:pilus assembly protein CpaF
MRRVETLLMQAAPTWPLPAIRRQVSRSIDIVVHVERGADGARRIVEIAETVEGDGEPTLRLLSGRHGLVAPLRRHRRSGR